MNCIAGYLWPSQLWAVMHLAMVLFLEYMLTWDINYYVDLIEQWLVILMLLELHCSSAQHSGMWMCFWHLLMTLKHFPFVFMALWHTQAKQSNIFCIYDNICSIMYSLFIMCALYASCWKETILYLLAANKLFRWFCFIWLQTQLCMYRKKVILMCNVLELIRNVIQGIECSIRRDFQACLAWSWGRSTGTVRWAFEGLQQDFWKCRKAIILKMVYIKECSCFWAWALRHQTRQCRCVWHRTLSSQSSSKKDCTEEGCCRINLDSVFGCKRVNVVIIKFCWLLTCCITLGSVWLLLWEGGWLATQEFSSRQLQFEEGFLLLNFFRDSCLTIWICIIFWIEFEIFLNKVDQAFFPLTLKRSILQLRCENLVP